MLYVIIIGLIALALDQITKQIIVHTMEIGEFKTIIPNFFDIFSVRNNGAAWSAQIPLWLLIIFTLVAIAIIIYLTRKLSIKKDKWLIITSGFILGGALGNFTDRLFYPDHLVVDFLSFTLYYPWVKDGKFIINTYDYPVFNVADIFIVIGAIMFLVYFIIIEPRKEKLKKKEESNNSNNETKEEIKE